MPITTRVAAAALGVSAKRLDNILTRSRLMISPESVQGRERKLPEQVVERLAIALLLQRDLRISSPYSRTRRAVEGSADNIQRFHNRALADPDRAREYVSREWAGAPIAERYEWLFRYDATKVEI